MHELFFGVKRAFHATLRLTRAGLVKMGLTAARFDLLYFLQSRSNGRAGGATEQRDIWRALGVSPPVVSRMLASLESIGLVRREKNPSDRRQRLVELTMEGRLRIRWAMRGLMDSGSIQLAIDTALASHEWLDANACFWAMCAFEEPIRAFRTTFGDTAQLAYRWHPDD